MNVIYTLLKNILEGCYKLCGSYGLAIILFTLLSKIILLPVSIWVQKNSIKMVRLMPQILKARIDYFGDRDTIAEEEHRIYKEGKYNAFASVVPSILQIVILLGVIGAIRLTIQEGTYNTFFCGIDLSAVPIEKGRLYLLAPLAAGASSYLLSWVSNRENVLQAEQNKGMQYGTMFLSIGISLWLGFVVPAGVILYWIASNLFSIVQQKILNIVFNPEKEVDFDALNEAKKELNELQKMGGAKRSREDIKREKEDYKRFFGIDNKHLVFYSESSGFYKYFKGVIEYLLETTNITIHYITSDPNDIIFRLAQQNSRIKPYYIGEKKLITLMMKMDADVVVMTMPDLDNYHIKRSYVRKDIEYIFIPHSMCSLNLTMRKASIDHFDTIFCTGRHQTEETRKTEEVYSLPEKKLVEWGYCLLDEMRADYNSKSHAEGDRKSILIAPSWQKGNIVDNCLDTILEALRGKGYQVTVRPHPQHVKHQPEKMEMLKKRFENDDDIVIQTDFSANNTVYDADIMITDWSGIAYEYSFTTYKPVVFIDTPLKIMNPEYEKLGIEPFNVWMRDILGKVVKVEEAGSIDKVIDEIFASEESYHEVIRKYAYDYVYNLDNSSKVGGDYIIEAVQRCIAKRKEKR